MAHDAGKRTDAQPPAKPGDALAGEVSIQAKVDKTGLTVAGRSRALMAADQLLGGLVGIPGGWLEGIRRRGELRREAREQFLQADIAAAMQQVGGLSELGRATAQRLLRDEYRKQDNRGSVWAAAEEHLALAPPPAQAKAEQSADLEGEVAEDPSIDPTWLNRFAGFAGDVSSEELQQVWGRVLAGEIRKPGSFSVSTLRVLAEMDPDVARDFESVYRLSAGDFAVRPEKFEGAVFELYARLEHAGLVQTDSFLRVQMPVRADGSAYMLGGTHLIRVTVPASHTDVSFPAVRLTRVGQQIGSILDRDEVGAMRAIASCLKPVEKVEICMITHRAGDEVGWIVVETLPAKAQ